MPSKKRLQDCIDSLRNSNQRLEIELLAATSRLANLEDEHDDLSNKHVKLMENMSVPRRWMPNNTIIWIYLVVTYCITANLLRIVSVCPHNSTPTSCGKQIMAFWPIIFGLTHIMPRNYFFLTKSIHSSAIVWHAAYSCRINMHLAGVSIANVEHGIVLDCARMHIGPSIVSTILPTGRIGQHRCKHATTDSLLQLFWRNNYCTAVVGW